MLQRAQPGQQVVGFGKRIQRLQADAIARIKGAGPNPAQPCDMAKAAQRCPQITGNGAHIAAFAADHFQFHMVRVGAGHHRKAFHPKRARGDIDHRTLPRQIISAVAVDFHGRKLRRGLHDLTPEPGKRRLDLAVIGAQIRHGNHLALGVIGVGRDPQPHHEAVALQCVGDIGHGFCRLAQCDSQNAGCRRVQRARMARLLCVERPAHLGHHGG